MVDNDAVTQPAEKDPSDWVTGDEPVTGPQQSYLSTLAQSGGRAGRHDRAQQGRGLAEDRGAEGEDRPLSLHSGAHPMWG